MKIGAIMQACRERAELSQEEMALRLERSQGYISKVERGKTVPDFVTVLKWSEETKSSEIMALYFFGIKAIRIADQIINQNAEVRNYA